jgi:hypothetical protein
MYHRPPAADEVEFSVFGRGYGEAICVHLGDDEWMLVDSCLEPGTGKPAGLAYLTSLGVAADKVRLIVITHWHDDHIRGVSDVVATCTNARVACPAVVHQKEFFAFVMKQEGAGGVLGSGVDEFRAVLKLCASPGGPKIVWAKANTPLHPSPPVPAPRVVAVSPSDEDFGRALGMLVQAATKSTPIARRYSAPPGPNGASIATSIFTAGGVALILGADLEKSSNQETGWNAVVKYCKPSTKASAVKIPHHGSVSAHDPVMWSDLLEPNPLAVVTPWVLGRGRLPTEGDLQRLKSLSKQTYITVTPTRLLTRKKPDKLLKHVSAPEIHEVRSWGHVRARRRAFDTTWRIELDGDAAQVN